MANRMHVLPAKRYVCKYAGRIRALFFIYIHRIAARLSRSGAGALRVTIWHM